MSGKGGGRSLTDMRAEHLAQLDGQPCVTRCLFCPWTYTGTVLEGRELAKGHRRVHHPDAVSSRNRKRERSKHERRAAERAQDHQRREEAA